MQFRKQRQFIAGTLLLAACLHASPLHSAARKVQLHIPGCAS